MSKNYFKRRVPFPHKTDRHRIGNSSPQATDVSMDQCITEANGQVITVHKGWTTRREKACDMYAKRPKSVKQPQESSSARILVWSSSADKPIPFAAGALSSSKSGTSKDPRQPTIVPRSFEFVHGTDPFRNRDPDVRKLVRAHAGRDSAHRKKQSQLRQQTKSPKCQDRDGELDGGFDTFQQAGHSIQPPRSMHNMNKNSPTKWIPDPSLTLISIKLDPQMTDLVHSLASVSTRMFPRESLFKFNPISPAHWFQYALADRALFHALMYSAFAYSSLFEGAVASNKIKTEFSQCVSLVSSTLAGPRVIITDGTIAAVACLALVEVVGGNQAGWRMHMNGVKQMVESRGSFSELSDNLKMKLLRADITGAVDFVTVTHFPFERSQRPSIYATLSFPELDVAADRLSTLSISYGLDINLTAIFTKLTRFSRALDFVLNYPSIPIDTLAFVEDSFEIRFELLSIPEPSFYDTDEVCIQEAMRIGALIFIKEVLQEYPLAPSGSSNLVRRLKDALSFVSDMRKYAPVILWLLFMGGVSSKKSLDRVWFMAHLMRVLPKNSTWQDVRSVLKKLLWVEKLFGHPCKELWDEIEITHAISS